VSIQEQAVKLVQVLEKRKQIEIYSSLLPIFFPPSLGENDNPLNPD
jgi:hypothetical protein